MNLVQVANDVKMLSDQQLQQIMQNPGSTPQYIIAGEMQRRQKLREDSSSPAQQGTVVDSLMTKVNQENEAKRKQSLMPMNEALPQGMGQPNIRGMAAGGVVRMARGERPDEGSGEGSGEDDELRKIDINELLKNFRPYAPVQRPQAPDLTAQDYLAALAPRIAEMEGRAKQYEKGALSRALMKAGAAMMASKNSSALGGIGEGFGAGLGGYVDDKAGTTKDLQAMMGMRSAIAQAQQQAAEALANRRTDMYGRDMGAAIVDSQSQNAHGLAQDRAVNDAFMQNWRLPLDNSTLQHNRAVTDVTRKQLGAMDANIEATKMNTLMNNTKDSPMAQFMWGVNNGDKQAMMAGYKAADLQNRMMMDQIAAHGNISFKLANMNKESALENSDQQKAAMLAQAEILKTLDSPMNKMLPQEQKQAIIDEAMPGLVAKYLQYLGRDKPKQMSVAPAAAEKPRLSFDLQNGLVAKGK